MGSTADHQFDHEEIRVKPNETYQQYRDRIDRTKDPFFYCQRCGAPVAFCQCPKLADPVKIGEQMADAMIQAVKDQLPKADPIKPNYYRRTIKGVEIDVIDIIQAWGIGFCLGNALKYILRAGQKDSREQDLKKAGENISRELEGTK